jgi:hypothetical protein
MAVTKLSNSGIKTGVLKYDSMLAGNPAYVPPGYDSIASTTVGSGGAATISFSGISAGYQHLVLRGSVRSTNASAGTDFYIQVNGDTGSNYDYSYGLFTPSSAVGSSLQNWTYMYGYKMTAANATAGYFSPFLVEFLDYANTNFHKTARFYSGYTGETGEGVAFAANTWRNTAAISSILIYPGSGNFAEHTTISLYGIRG